MPSTLTARATRTHANPDRASLDEIRAGKANLRIDAKNLGNAPGIESIRPLVREAMRRAGLSQKAFAIDAGITESVLSEALSGARHLSVDWLWSQGDLFVAELIKLVSERRNLTEQTQRSLRAERVAELVRLLLEVA